MMMKVIQDMRPTRLHHVRRQCRCQSRFSGLCGTDNRTITTRTEVASIMPQLQVPLYAVGVYKSLYRPQPKQQRRCQHETSIQQQQTDGHEKIHDGNTRMEQEEEEGEQHTQIYTLSSGTTVVEHEMGTGSYPEEGEYVSIHCVGRLKDGAVFEDTYNNNRPLYFVHGATQVVIGLEEALSYLPVGTKAKVIVPGHAAYGYRRHGIIPPNSTLYFDIHILGVGEDAHPPKPRLMDRIKEFFF